MEIEVMIGDSAGLMLSDDQMLELNLSLGDRMQATTRVDGSVLLLPQISHFEKAMQITEEVMKEYNNALTELAK